MLTSKIKSIEDFGDERYDAKSGDSITICLEDDIDISRGNMIVPSDNLPEVAKEFNVMMCWFNEKPMLAKGKYILRHSTNEVKAILSSINTKLNINTLEEDTEDKEVRMNDIANVTIKVASPVFIDDYKNNHVSGSIILIDEATNETVAAGMVVK
jgi:sulfate adenylyltransferase subunit 1